MFKNPYILFIILTLVLLSKATFAMQVDTMLLVSDKQGNGVFSITNNLSKTSLISGRVVEVNVVKGQIKEVPYTKENLSNWKITLTNPNLIVEPTRTKQVGVRSLCGGDCNFEKDHVYEVYFSPIPYDKGQGNKTPTLGVNYGFAPIYIIPAAKSHVDYVMENRGDKLYVKNNGNTFLKVQIDACRQAKVKQQCRATYTVLAGRETTFNIPEKLQSSSLPMRTSNHDNSYFKEFALKEK